MQKSYPFQAKSVNDDQGIVEAVVSVFGNVDSDGDIVEQGAFARSIKEGKEKGRLPPGVWMHDWRQPVARTYDAREEEDGLHVIGQFNMGTQRGREAFSDIKMGLVTEYSFGFEIRDRDERDGVQILKDLEWFEWSPVLVGANRETHTVGVKAEEKPHDDWKEMAERRIRLARAQHR